MNEEPVTREAVTYDPRTETHRVRLDWTHDEPVSDTVVKAVAAAERVCPSRLEPLYDHVDPEALDELFEPTRTGTRTALGHTSFTYAGYVVTVHSDGEVVVRRRNEPRDSVSGDRLSPHMKSVKPD